MLCSERQRKDKGKKVDVADANDDDDYGGGDDDDGKRKETKRFDTGHFLPSYTCTHVAGTHRDCRARRANGHTSARACRKLTQTRIKPDDTDTTTLIHEPHQMQSSKPYPPKRKTQARSARQTLVPDGKRLLCPASSGADKGLPRGRGPGWWVNSGRSLVSGARIEH